jgi:hypothetical protein
VKQQGKRQAKAFEVVLHPEKARLESIVVLISIVTIVELCSEHMGSEDDKRIDFVASSVTRRSTLHIEVHVKPTNTRVNSLSTCTSILNTLT